MSARGRGLRGRARGPGAGSPASGREGAGAAAAESLGAAWVLLRALLLQPADCFAGQQGAVQAHLVSALFPVSRFRGQAFLRSQVQ